MSRPGEIVPRAVIVSFGRLSETAAISGVLGNLMFVAIILGVFFAIYMLYVVSSYISFKRGILPENK